MFAFDGTMLLMSVGTSKTMKNAMHLSETFKTYEFLRIVSLDNTQFETSLSFRIRFEMNKRM